MYIVNWNKLQGRPTSEEMRLAQKFKESLRNIKVEAET
jgi:hypothetical protein